MAIHPIARSGKTQSPVEFAAVARHPVPGLRRLSEMPDDAVAIPVIVKPLAEAWPFTDQRFVDDLDGVRFDGEEAGIAQATNPPQSWPTNTARSTSSTSSRSARSPQSRPNP